MRIAPDLQNTTRSACQRDPLVLGDGVHTLALITEKNRSISQNNNFFCSSGMLSSMTINDGTRANKSFLHYSLHQILLAAVVPNDQQKV